MDRNDRLSLEDRSNLSMELAVSLNAGSVGIVPSIPIHRNVFVANVLLFPWVFGWALIQWIHTKLRSRTNDDVSHLEDWSDHGVAGHHVRSSSSSVSQSSFKKSGGNSASFNSASSTTEHHTLEDLPTDAPLSHFILVSRRNLNRTLDRVWQYAPQAQLAIALVTLGCIGMFGAYALLVLGPRGGVRHAWTKWWRRGADLGYTNFQGINAQQQVSFGIHVHTS